jgi:plastocyanin
MAIKHLLRNFKLVTIGVLVFGFVASFATASLLAQPSTIQASTTCNGSCVAITRTGMVPNELAIKAGTFVQFNSADGSSHNIAHGEGGGDTHGHASHGEGHEHIGGVLSGEFGADEAWRVQFNTPGTYQLHDHNYPEKNILVVVY